jgi:hypothetical protein
VDLGVAHELIAFILVLAPRIRAKTVGGRGSLLNRPGGRLLLVCNPSAQLRDCRLRASGFVP